MECQDHVFSRVLDLYREPLFVIDASRFVHFKNAAGARVIRSRSGFGERNGYLTMSSPATEAALKEQLDTGSKRAEQRALRLARPGAARDWLLLVQFLGSMPPLSAHAPLFLLRIVGRTRPRAGSSSVLRDLFGLTARELAVVTQLQQSGQAHRAAVRLVLSHETVRSHLKRIYRKCDVHSQGELMSLLHSLAEFTNA